MSDTLFAMSATMEPRPALALFWSCVGVAFVAGAGAFANSERALGPTQLALATAMSACGLAALAMAGAAWWGRGIARSLGLEAGRVGGIRVAMLAAGVVGTSQLLDAVLSSSGWRDTSVLPKLDQMIGAAHGAEWLALVLAVGVMASVAEELLFRGFVLRWCTTRFDLATGVVASSLIFGLLHLDLAQGGAAVILGMWLAGVALVAGSTRAAIVCHIANNLAALLGVAQPFEAGPLPLLAAGVCASLGAWTLYGALRGGLPPGGLQVESGSADL